MPRAPRCVVVDFPLHIVQRGISRNACFFADGDYRTYLRDLHAFSAEFGCSVHAYCLMTNHVHLLVTPHAVDACALLMKKLGQCYVQGVNQRLGRSGTLWEGRFRSCCVSSDATPSPAIDISSSTRTRRNGSVAGAIPVVELLGKRARRT